MSTLVPQIGYFAWNWSVSFWRKDILATTGGSDMLWETVSIIFRHIREVRKHLSSNGCLSLQHGITIPCLIWCAPNWLFILKIETIFCRQDTLLTIKGSGMISDALHLVLIHIRMAEKHSSLYIYLLLSHSIIFRGLIWCPKLAILLKIGVFLLGENIVVGHMGVRYAIRSSLDHSYISNGG